MSNTYTVDGKTVKITLEKKGWMVWGYMYSVSRLYLSERAAQAVLAAAPFLTFAEIEPAMRAAHKVDRSGGSNEEVRLACFSRLGASTIEDALRGCRGVGAALRLPGGVVVRYEHEAPQGGAQAAPWYSASKRGGWRVQAQDRAQLAAVLAAHYADLR